MPAARPADLPGGRPSPRQAGAKEAGRKASGEKAAGSTGTGATGELGTYQSKRDFTRTPEPAGAAPSAAGPGPSAAGDGPPPAGGGAPRFVVQRHRARRLHYDLRFEIGGVLVSWAVPRGPTLDPGVRRIAIHVEDHPLEYLHFEGVIPAGGYGGGDVIVWDTGTWEPHETDDPAAAVAAGELHVDISGTKLRGRLILIRTGAPTGPGQEQWLLLHKHDEYAVPGWNPEDYPASVLSGRTNDEVKADPEREWRSDLPAAEASVPVPRAKPAGGGRAAASGAKRAAAAPAKPARSRPGTESPAPATDGLSQLDALGGEGSLDVFGRRLRLTNLDKQLFGARPGEAPVTKRELIRYAIQVAPVALPYLAGRALNMHRFPGGAQSPGFWHKQLPDHAPGWVGRWTDPAAKPGRTSTYLVVNEPATLVWAANFGALEWHAWTAPTDHPDQPSYALIDIDPGTETSWADILVLARLHRAALEHLGVLARPKLTGRRGLQIWVPIGPGPDFTATRAWIEQLSRSISAVVPELVSWKWDVRERDGKARLDYTQNAASKTLVAPYSPRAEPGAPISAPLDWDELDDPQLRPGGVTIRTALDRLAERGDPFRVLLTSDQELPLIR